MIIGKPITFGSSGLMAEIIASGDVLSTDTITCTNGIKSYSAIWVTDHFVISGLDLGTYTVTATRGSKVIPYTVLIDEIAQYEVEIEWKLYLYNQGDECESITGGWGTTGYSSIWRTLLSGTKYSEYFNTNSTSDTSKQTMLGTLQPVDMSAYSKICIDANGVTVLSNEASYLAIYSSKDVSDVSTRLLYQAITSSGRHTYEALLNGITSGYATVVAVNTRSANTYKIWLE